AAGSDRRWADGEPAIEHECAGRLLEPDQRLVAGQLVQRKRLRGASLDHGAEWRVHAAGYDRGGRHQLQQRWALGILTVLLRGPRLQDHGEQEELLGVLERRLRDD